MVPHRGSEDAVLRPDLRQEMARTKVFSRAIFLCHLLKRARDRLLGDFLRHDDNPVNFGEDHVARTDTDSSDLDGTADADYRSPTRNVDGSGSARINGEAKI